MKGTHISDHWALYLNPSSLLYLHPSSLLYLHPSSLLYLHPSSLRHLFHDDGYGGDVFVIGELAW